jgi:hypothetical protein
VALWGAAVSMVVAGALWFSGTKYLPTDTKAIETADGGASTKNLSIPNRNPISVRCRFRYEEDKIRIGLGENRRWKTKSSLRAQGNRGNAVHPRGFPGLVNLRYGVALGSAGEDSSDVSVLLLLLFFELPVSLVPSSLVVSRCLPVACSVVVSSELLVAGEAVALLSP